MENRKPRSRKKKPFGLKGWAAIVGGTVAAAALIAALVYFQTGRQYEKVFFPNTTINGIDASKKSAEDVKKLIASGIDGYVLKISERGGNTEEIKGSGIGLEAVFDGSLEALLAQQKPLEWIRHIKTPQTFDIGTMIKFDQEKFDGAVSALTCLKEELIEEPRNAYISDYVPGQGYSIVAAKEGNRPDTDKLRDAISEAVLNLTPEISLEEQGVYVNPGVSSDDPGLIEKVQTLNRYVSAVITYKFGDEKKVLNGETISGWIGIGEDGKAYLSSSAVAAYVKELASKYDTSTRAKNLKTSYGQNVRITGGSYGWKIDQSAEADELAELIRSGQNLVKEPVYKQKAASHGTADYGNTYVEINLTAQHLFFYKDGKLVVESDFVSGNETKGWSTPAGVYSLTYKERNATLKGENYSTPVSYWMPFNGNIGLHDASWRNAFGGTIYKTNGSHGCVNLPPDVAKTIFENISAGIPVLCYHLPGTEAAAASGKPAGTTETKAAGEETAANPASGQTETPAQTTAAPTTAAPTTAAPETEKSTTEASTESREAGPGGSSSTGRKKVGPGVSQ
ncbi:L,D-transpeptidase family protein [Lachnospiraceae bacterium 54-53]